MNSTFSLDMKIEQEVNKYLDKYIYPILRAEYGLEFIRVNDKNLQQKGVDIIGNHKLFNQSIKIDEKTATHYFQNDLSKSGLKTFALELSYTGKNNSHKYGWLYNSKYSETDAYLFNWGWTTKEIDNWKDIKFENIIQIESILVLKKDLLKYLDLNYEFNKATYTDFISEYNIKKSNDKFFIKENSGPYILQSSKSNYHEAPTNLIFPKNELIKICKKHIIHNINESRSLYE